MSSNFAINQIYRRRDLHNKFGGQRQGGISTPSKYPFIMIFSGIQGEKYGYQDGRGNEGIFFYTGEGQRGDMSFERGNMAIRDHAQNGKDIHLFEYVRPGYVRYLGQMVCNGYQILPGKDVDGNSRNIIVFELMSTNMLDISSPLDTPEDDKQLWKESLETLRERALASSTKGRTPTERKTLNRYRSQAIRVYVLKRADGICEACRKKAPFITTSGRPYLEPHHIYRLSDGGPDDPRRVIALCPNCHRRAHYGKDSSSFNKNLARIVSNLEGIKR